MRFTQTWIQFSPSSSLNVHSVHRGKHSDCLETQQKKVCNNHWWYDAASREEHAAAVGGFDCTIWQLLNYLFGNLPGSVLQLRLKHSRVCPQRNTLDFLLPPEFDPRLSCRRQQWDNSDTTVGQQRHMVDAVTSRDATSFVMFCFICFNIHTVCK